MSGDYIAIKLNNQTRKAIRQFCKDNQIPYRKPSGQLHTSVMISDNNIPTFKPRGYLDVPLQGFNPRLEKWSIQPDKQLLTIVFDSSQLVREHNTIIQMHKAISMFSEFIPHITLTYSMDDRTVQQLPYPIEQYVEELTFSYEYKEPRKA